MILPAKINKRDIIQLDGKNSGGTLECHGSRVEISSHISKRNQNIVRMLFNNPDINVRFILK